MQARYYFGVEDFQWMTSKFSTGIGVPLSRQGGLYSPEELPAQIPVISEARASPRPRFPRPKASSIILRRL